MKISTETAKLLTEISTELTVLKDKVQYKGYWDDCISNEDAIAALCDKVNDLVEILLNNCTYSEPDYLTKEDYEETRYGWGDQR